MSVIPDSAGGPSSPASPAIVSSNSGDGGDDLKADAIGPWGVFAQGLAAAAPSVAIASVPIALFVAAGTGAFWAVIVGLVIVLLLAATISFQARRTVTSGSLGTYTGNGLGSGFAFASGFSLLLGYIGFATTGSLGAVLYLNAFLDSIGLGSQETWFRILLIVIVIAIAIYFPFRGVSITAKYELIFEVIALAIILVVIVAAYVSYGPALDAEQFNPIALTQSSTFVAAVIAVGSYAGFESVASLGKEAKDAHRSISRALVRVVIILGAVYVFSTYPQVLHFDELDLDTAVLPQVAASAGISWINVFVSAAVTIAMIVFVTAVVNSAARSIFTFAREGALPKVLGRVHHTYKTPVAGILLVGIVATVFAVFASVSSAGRLIFDIYAGYVATWGFIISYFLVAIATPIWLYKIKALTPVRLIVSALAVLGIGYVVFSNFVPVPEWPFNILPLIFLALLALGLVRYFYLRVRRPEVAKRIGTTQTLSVEERERLTTLGLLAAASDEDHDDAVPVARDAGIEQR